jgi:DNA transformation protein and related proteins
MPVSKEYLQYVLEQLSGVGRVTSRRMFGGVGLYCDALFFGLLDNDTLYFKVGDSNRPDYEQRGMSAFRPFPDKPYVSMTYYEVPADALEDAEELRNWARKSLSVALATSRTGQRQNDMPMAPKGEKATSSKRNPSSKDKTRSQRRKGATGKRRRT